MGTQIRLETELGPIVIDVAVEDAPVTSAYVIELVERGRETLVRPIR